MRVDSREVLGGPCPDCKQKDAVIADLTESLDEAKYDEPELRAKLDKQRAEIARQKRLNKGLHTQCGELSKRIEEKDEALREITKLATEKAEKCGRQAAEIAHLRELYGGIIKESRARGKRIEKLEPVLEAAKGVSWPGPALEKAIATAQEGVTAKITGTPAGKLEPPAELEGE